MMTPSKSLSASLGTPTTRTCPCPNLSSRSRCWSSCRGRSSCSRNSSAAASFCFCGSIDMVDGLRCRQRGGLLVVQLLAHCLDHPAKFFIVKLSGYRLERELLRNEGGAQLGELLRNEGGAHLGELVRALAGHS